MPDDSVDLGTFVETIISDNVDIKTALQELESALAPITDGLDFQGLWDANTNTPTLTSSTGTKGHFYIVDTAGSTNLDGITDWNVGDWAVFDGTVWRQVDNTDAVNSVNGQTGSVVLDADDIDDSATTNKFANNASIDDLTDVDTTTTPPNNNDALVFDSGSGNWIPGEGGGGGGAGGISWITGNNSDFENGTGDWTAFNESPYADGDGGTVVSLAVSQTTTASEVLNETGSLKVSKSASDSSGDGVSVLSDETIGRGFRGRKQILRFLWEPSANYISEDLKIRAFGVDSDAGANSKIIPVIPISGALEDSNGLAALPDFQTEVVCEVLSDENHDKIRLSLHLETDNAPASTWDVFLDEVRLSPDQVVPGFAGSDSRAIEGAVSNLSTNIQVEGGFWSRRGDKMYVTAGLEFSGTNTEGRINPVIANSKSIDTGKLFTDTTTTAGEDRVPVGQWKIADSSTSGNNQQGQVVWDTSLSEIILEIDGADQAVDTSSNNPITIADGDTVMWWFEVPISGWDAGAQLSTTENMFKNASVRASGNGGESITADVTDITFTEVDDPFNLWNGSTFQPKEDGFYVFFGHVFFTSSQNRQVELFNADTDTALQRIGERLTSNSHHFAGGHFLEAGVNYSIRTHFNGGTLSDNDNLHHLTILSWKDLSAFSVTGESSITVLKDVKASGSAGGTATAGSFATRDLNTLIVTGESNVSLSSNQFTLNPGTYEIEASAPGHQVSSHQIRLQNITDSTTQELGTTEQMAASSTDQSRSHLFSTFNISSKTTFEIQHRVETSNDGNDFGLPASFGDEVYTIVKINKVR